MKAMNPLLKMMCLSKSIVIICQRKWQIKDIRCQERADPTKGMAIKGWQMPYNYALMSAWIYSDVISFDIR